MTDNITFDEVFDDNRPQLNAGPHPHAMMDITNTKDLDGADMDMARVVSHHSGRQAGDASLAAPVSPCTTDECSRQQHPHQPALARPLLL